MGLQPAKKEKEPKAIPWGFNANAKPKAEANKEEQEHKKAAAKERFEQLQQEKRDKAKQGNPALQTYQAMMKNMDKKEKDQQKRDAVNPRVKDAEIKAVNPSAFAASGADKVPVEAGMVNDLEGMSKEAKDLTKTLKQMFFDNK